MDEARATRWPGVGVVVLTGGANRRLGRDKSTAHVGGRPLADRILADVPADVPVVIVVPSQLRGLAAATGFGALPPVGAAAGATVRWLPLPT